MLFAIKEKFWAWGNDFTIDDAEGRSCFRVDGKAFSWGDDLSFQDMEGCELARIKQRLFSFKPSYELIVRGKVFAEVIKEWSWFNKKFTLDVPGPNDYTIDGSFWAHEFTFVRKGRIVATVSKSFWSWTDGYGVEVADDEDAVSILCACIVIDQVLHDDEKKNHGLHIQ